MVELGVKCHSPFEADTHFTIYEDLPQSVAQSVAECAQHD